MISGAISYTSDVEIAKVRYIASYRGPDHIIIIMAQMLQLCL